MSGPGDPPATLHLVRVEVPLRRAHRSAKEVEAVRDVILVGWARSDGVTGWGECPTLGTDAYATGSTDGAWHALTTSVGPAVIEGRSIRGAGPAAALGAVRDARLDASLRSRGLSLAEHLGSVSRTVARTKVLADVGGDPAELAALARLAVAGGARMIKVKIAPGDDLARLHTVRGAVGRVPLAADANGAYESRSDVVALDDFGLAYLEQPFRAGLGWEELADLQGGLVTPIALDESIASTADVVAAAAAGALGVVSLKPARMGGIEEALAAGVAAEGLGLAAFVGGMLELVVGRAGAAALAACGFCVLPSDLGPSQDYVVEDLAEDVVVDGAGDLVVPSGPGNGREPLLGRLEQVCTAWLRLE